jgi:hypothetical protein
VDKTESSIADALGRAHEALLADLQELKKAVRPFAAESLQELRARLRAAHAHITDHFRLEEHNGYMDIVRKREPRLERAIRELAEEHCLLTESLDALLMQAKAAENLEDTLREGIREWIKRVRRHEIRENDIIQDAFDLDIGPED